MGIDWREQEKSEGNAFLKAGDVKAEKIVVVPKAFREVVLQFSGKSVIMDFDLKGKLESIPLNKTNVKKLNELTNYNPESLINKMLVLRKVNVTNPKTKMEVQSWRIDGIKAEKKPEKIKG
jgi:hypothetical protein